MSNFEVKLIRHASGTHMNSANLLTGRMLDAQLTEAGMAEAASAGYTLLEHGNRPDIVFASPAHRAQETARLVLRAMNIRMPISTDPLLHEMDMGTLVGTPRPEVYTDVVKAEISRLGKKFKLPGAESSDEVAVRGLGFLEKQRHSPVERSSTWGFTHAGLIASTVGEVEGWDFDKIVTMRKTIAPVSETTLVLEGGVWHVDTFAKPLADQVDS